MSFFKNIWKTNSKHKKLSEEWALAKNKENDIELTEHHDPESEVLTFDLKYIGSTLVERANSETVTAEAIETILRVAKIAGKKLPLVTVTVSLNGIKVSEQQSGKDILEVSIYRISYCSADAAHSRVFAFIASNPNETIECHAFLCAKRKLAQAVTLTVARAFSMAYEAWRVLPSSSKEKDAETSNYNTSSTLVDLDDPSDPKTNDMIIPRPRGFSKTEWVSFDDDNDSQKWSDTYSMDQNINLIS